MTASSPCRSRFRVSSSLASTWLVVAVALPGQGRAQAPAGALAGHEAPSAHAELAAFEDYREPAGRLENGVLRVSLEARAALWRPWGGEGPALPAHTFAVAGAPSRIPGPLIRVTAGTPVHVTLRNTLGDTLLVRGLRDRGQQLPPGVPPGPALAGLAFVGDSAVVAPGATVEVRFTPTVPGSYFYFGKTMEEGWSARRQPLFGAKAPDRALAGLLVVDAPGEAPDPDERMLLISHWADREIPETWLPAARFLINGRAWPHTERLGYTQGDTVRWRVINQSGAFHPMHLHGFHFRVDELTSQTGGSLLDVPEERPLAVTQTLQPSTAMRMSWVADEPGNWIFHCHLMRHMSWIQHPSFGDGDRSPGLQGEDDDHVPGPPEGADLMGGLVLGVTVRPAEGYEPRDDVPRRRIRLHVGRRDSVFGDEPAYGFVLQEGDDPPAADSVRFPGSPLVLTRDEPTEIVVRNRADVPLGVHWHGLELESWADGVPGWSGMPGSVRPAVAPGDSFVVRMTPPRAGSFMYHVHSEPGHQLAQGLYGPFLVLEPGERWDPETDRVFLLGSLGAGVDPPPAVNGRLEPEALELRAGTRYRFRFMHISPDDEKRVSLLADDGPVEWRMLARDGADLPPTLARVVPADLRIHVGETHDVVWTPEAAGDHTLRIVTTFDRGLAAFPREAPPPVTTDIPVRVR